MEPSRLKNVIILLLLCVNLALGGMLAYNALFSGRIDREDLRETSEYLAARGLTLADGALPGRVSPPERVEYARDGESEAAVAAALLGATEFSAPGGGISVYAGEAGRAVFRRGGLAEITIAPTGDVPGNSSEAVKRARALLRSAGIALPDGEAVCGREGSGLFVTFRRTFRGCEVAGGELTVLFEVSGTSLTGFIPAGRASPDGEECRSLQGLLADFAWLNTRYALGAAEITEARYAYYRSASDSGGAVLIPVCVVTTDAGEFTVNALDGSLIK